VFGLPVVRRIRFELPDVILERRRQVTDRHLIVERVECREQIDLDTDSA
jgi:hypothetical protein